MTDPFQAALAFTLDQEGGVANNPADPGGLTNRGLTMADLRQFSRAAVQHDLLALTVADITAIYLALYWLPVAGWQLPPPIALMVFDHGVNCGIGDSARLLQRRLLVTPDGQIGRDTLTAMRRVRHQELPALLAQLNADQLTDYGGKSDAGCFLKGWTARLAARVDAARALYFTT